MHQHADSCSPTNSLCRACRNINSIKISIFMSKNFKAAGKNVQEL